MFKGELISIAVSLSWTITAIFSEIASKRLGSLTLNVIRMALALILLAASLWITIGVPYPAHADFNTWFWLGLSGFVGYVFGDYCLFSCYMLIGSRFGQLFMTLAAPTAAISAWLMLGENMTTTAIAGMITTTIGIGMSILGKEDKNSKVKLKLPLKGVLYAIGAGVGQGLGLVLSKIGMQAYETALASQNLSFGIMTSFAGTMMRATIGMIGFSIVFFIFTNNTRKKLYNAITDKKAITCTLCATFFGPFLGVSMSLLATLYTNTGIAQTLMALTPIFILIPAYFVFKQRVTITEILGATISVAGASLFFI